MNTSQQVELGKIFFEDGIPGFSHLQFFQLIQEEESRLFLIQSTEEKDVGFWAIDPFVYFPNYEFSLTPTVKTSLSIGDNTGIAVFCIVTIRGNNQVTVNLKAPVVVNLSNRMGKQIILQEDTYLIRQPLFESGATDKK
ncbi:flagellar assembly protein FliW [Brevibacillus porteri]|uniref:Flagellar assembly factor FliW n=1 Tax=Brevibacillus porteri TaxID=2126350 RepID=A0ABX5FMW6_9BACL|nr:flagellar assembly protein FliW [Brevibacillus porteri]MED1801446.1 flagellar assembly protein FliW [Brevibacillus porteri]MED2133851.1 flagellar assembly protein FliW [Brevibacillus porteri]MED2748257.1 flagellar assembly protein FliW [Brevibacillus porteri]MED2815395.1 flagellar assembly protein FliW [Brevibacillus porteri]MED2894798.1 flagellar assembly protein FliW [Brevibacillus porteri]